MWRCLKCSKVYGPRTGTEISRYPYSRCCPRRLDERKNYKGYKEITGSKMTQYKDSARRRGLEFTVTKEYLWELFELQDRRCAYTGIDLIHGQNVSLDRIDSDAGYVKGNVQWVDWTVNRMKSNIKHDEFVRLCSLIANRMEKK